MFLHTQAKTISATKLKEIINKKLFYFFIDTIICLEQLIFMMNGVGCKRVVLSKRLKRFMKNTSWIL